MSNTTPETGSSNRPGRRGQRRVRSDGRFRSLRHEAAFNAAVDYSFGLMSMRTR